MTQKLRALAALTEDLSSVSSIHMAIYKCLYLQFQGIWHPPLVFTDTAHMWFLYIYAGKTLTHIKCINKLLYSQNIFQSDQTVYTTCGQLG